MFFVINEEQFNHITNCSTCHEAWYVLEVTHEKTSQVQETKIKKKMALQVTWDDSDSSTD